MSFARILLSGIANRFVCRHTNQTASCVLRQERSFTLGQSASGMAASGPRSSGLLSVAPALSCCQVRTYKTKAVLKLRCSGCYFVKKFGRLHVECTLKPRHKQMQIMTGTALYKDDYSKGKWMESIHWQWRQREGFYQKGNTDFAKVDWLKGKIGTEV